MLLCTFCKSKECKNANSLRNHERLCHCNPNKQISTLARPDIQATQKRSNAAIKAKEEGKEFVVSQETRNKVGAATSARTAEWNKANGKKIAKTINEKVTNGEWHTSLAKHMHVDYNGIDLHGSWEVKYAQYLDLHNIPWIRNKDSFTYEFEGKSRKYTPDFYLLQTDEYIEIKGYKTEKDDAKWTQFPKHRKLIVLMGEDLKKMGVM